MDENAWVKEFPAAVTVCDAEGRILEMNERAAASFEKDGGAGLIGTNVLDCHPEPSRTNVYTIEKKGAKKLIYQSPWYAGGVYAGFVELSFEIPWDMPHFNRDR
jgi:PAS domain-containing protein